MITLIVTLFIIMVLLRIGWMLTGMLLGTLIWVCFRLPIGLVLLLLGVLLCCTLILIPIGKVLIKWGVAMIIPA